MNFHFVPRECFVFVLWFFFYLNYKLNLNVIVCILGCWLLSVLQILMLPLTMFLSPGSSARFNVNFHGLEISVDIVQASSTATQIRWVLGREHFAQNTETIYTTILVINNYSLQHASSSSRKILRLDNCLQELKKEHCEN